MKIPDYIFFITDTLLIFDHLTNQIIIVSNAIIDGPCEQIYKKAVENIEKIVDLLSSPLSGVKCLEPGDLKELPAFESNFKKDDLKGECSNCKYGKSCKGGCSTVSSTLSGELHNNPYCFHLIEQKMNF